MKVVFSVEIINVFGVEVAGSGNNSLYRYLESLSVNSLGVDCSHNC